MRPPIAVSRVAAALLLSVTALAACGTTQEAAIELVAPAAASQVLEDHEDVVLLDVRTPEEFAESRVPGAINIDYMEPGFAAELEALDKDASYVVYCRSGARSAEAISVMRDLGFTRVWEVDGGIVAWSAAGLPTEP